MEQSFLTALSGGLAGAVITLITQSFLRHWNRPILEIRFNDEGCNVRTQGVMMDSERKAVRDAQGKPRVIEQRYLRLKVINKGKTFAKSVSACVTRINYRDQRAGGQATFEAEVCDLKLALTVDRVVFDLAAGGHRFVDLVHAQQEVGEQSQIGFDFVKVPFNLLSQRYDKGKYQMKVFVAAENAQSVPGDFDWSWNGVLDDLAFTGKVA